ncbi:MAG TPA: winged helix-turn-helix domain-containing protein [Chloroflexota bacterium]|nr:winged helix-turn-helix domain-containing protein [Chloroflexota bacterium]
MGQDVREWRRLRAWELHRAGWSGKAIAEALGASQAAVSTWLKRARAGGVEALKRHPPPGATPKLTAEQRAQLPALLAKGAEWYDFVGNVWTTKRVAAVVKREFGVSYHPAHVSRLVRQAGLSLQKPVVRATQRNEDAIRVWQTETWPALEAKRGLRTARSSS